MKSSLPPHRTWPPHVATLSDVHRSARHLAAARSTCCSRWPQSRDRNPPKKHGCIPLLMRTLSLSSRRARLGVGGVLARLALATPRSRRDVGRAANLSGVAAPRVSAVDSAAMLLGRARHRTADDGHLPGSCFAGFTTVGCPALAPACRTPWRGPRAPDHCYCSSSPARSFEAAQELLTDSGAVFRVDLAAMERGHARVEPPRAGTAWRRGAFRSSNCRCRRRSSPEMGLPTSGLDARRTGVFLTDSSTWSRRPRSGGFASRASGATKSC